MHLSRSEFLGLVGATALRAALTKTLPRPVVGAPSAPDFDIDGAFAAFMRGIGGTPGDGGGSVTFIGSDPLVRSHFRIGTSMAVPAAGTAVGAAAIWKERTGQGQDVRVDLREAIYNVNPIIALVLRQKQVAGLI